MNNIPLSYVSANSKKDNPIEFYAISSIYKCITYLFHPVSFINHKECALLYNICIFCSSKISQIYNIINMLKSVLFLVLFAVYTSFYKSLRFIKLFILYLFINTIAIVYAVNIQQILPNDDRESYYDGDMFGYSVSISNNVAIVGAPYDDDQGIDSGSAYIFQYNGTTWNQIQTLVGSHHFGISVSISDNIAVIGSNNVDGLSKAYVYEHDGTSWVHVQVLEATPAPQYEDVFGSSVCVSDDTIIIGAPGLYIDYHGAAYIFNKNNSGWFQTQKLVRNRYSSYDEFGRSVSLSKNTAIIGDMSETHIFENNGTSWNEVQELPMERNSVVSLSDDKAMIGSGTEVHIYQKFGNSWNRTHWLRGSLSGYYYSVYLSNNTAIMGADRRYEDGNIDHAYIFQFNGSEWIQKQALFDEPNVDQYGFEIDDQFGFAVALSNNRAIIGAPYHDRSGCVYIVEDNGISWIKTHKIVPDDLSGFDEFGVAVSISNNRAIVVSHMDYIPPHEWDDAPGSVNFFEYNGNSWDFVLKEPAARAASVSISNDTAIVGAHHNDSYWSVFIFERTSEYQIESDRISHEYNSENYGGFGISVAVCNNFALVGADKSNAVYVFMKDETSQSYSWNEVQKLIPTDRHSNNDRFGHSVSMSNDISIIGAYADDTIAIMSGAAYVFKYNGTQLNAVQKLVANDGGKNHYFGNVVCISNGIAIIGAVGANRAYIFENDGISWNQKQTLVPTDTEAENFGFSVSISKDLAIVGSYLDKDGRGSAFIFEYNGDFWDQIRILIPNHDQSDQYFGYSVSISNGVALVGAYGADDVGLRSGSAYFFDKIGSTANPTTDPTLAPTKYPTLPTIDPTQRPTRSPIARDEFDSYIPITYELIHLSNVENKPDLTQSLEYIPLTIKNKYYDPGLLLYKQFMINIETIIMDGTEINDVDSIFGVLDSSELNSDIETRWQTADELVLETKVDCNENPISYCEYIKQKSQIRNAFVGDVTADLVEYFNNDKLEFLVRNPDSLQIICKDCRDANYIYYGLYSICGFIILIALFALLFNKGKFPKLPGFHVVDDGKWTALMIFGLQFWDFASDINLSVEIWSRDDLKQNKWILYCAIASTVFTLIPYTANLIIAARVKNIIKGNEAAKSWFQSNTAIFTILVVLTGGCYPAIALISSSIFGLEIMTSGLTLYELKKLSKIKVFWTVFTENLPQIIIQALYCVAINTISDSVKLAFFGSLLSVTATLLGYFIDRDINDREVVEYYLSTNCDLRKSANNQQDDGDDTTDKQTAAHKVVSDQINDDDKDKYVAMVDTAGATAQSTLTSNTTISAAPTQSDQITDDEKKKFILNRGRTIALSQALAEEFGIPPKNIEIGYSTITKYGIITHVVHYVSQMELHSFQHELEHQDIVVSVQYYTYKSYLSKKKKINTIFIDHFELNDDFEVKYINQIAAAGVTDKIRALSVSQSDVDDKETAILRKMVTHGHLAVGDRETDAVNAISQSLVQRGYIASKDDIYEFVNAVANDEKRDNQNDPLMPLSISSDNEKKEKNNIEMNDERKSPKGYIVAKGDINEERDNENDNDISMALSVAADYEKKQENNVEMMRIQSDSEINDEQKEPTFMIADFGGNVDYSESNNWGLPSGFTVNKTSEGKLFFVDHNRKNTTWNDPRSLPFGWRADKTNDGNTFYINDSTKTTTWNDPRPPINI